MNNPALEQLRDIHLPQAVQWWPPAPGWWIVTALTLALLVWLVRYLQGRYRRRYFRSESLDLLQQIWLDYQQAYPRGQTQQATDTASADRVLIEETLALLRRAGKTAQLSTHHHNQEPHTGSAHEPIESLPSAALLKVLDQQSAGKLSAQLPLEHICERLYRAESTALSPEQARCFYEVAKHWLKAKDFSPQPAIGEH